MRTIERQYLTFYAVLGETRKEQMDDDDLMERLRRTHAKAYTAVEASWKSIPGRVQQDDDEVESSAFDLCVDDVLVEDLNGFAVFGIGFTSYSHVPLESVKAIRDCVERAYAVAASADGITSRFVRAERMNVLQVTETTEVDFEAEPPAIE